ncbi:Peptidyl-prolyl cis-trans isomerase FKBP62 [Bienertia sinuspersici]
MESLEICRTFQEDLKDILFDGSNLESEDAELYDYISSLKNHKDRKETPLLEGDLDGALEKYSLSMQLVLFLIWLLVFLRRKSLRQGGHFCSIILNHNPDSVKALFRRANAAMGLGNYELASWDLKVAHEVEPSNQEVMRKLREVEQILNSLPEKNHGQGKKEGEMSLGFRITLRT